MNGEVSKKMVTKTIKLPESDVREMEEELGGDLNPVNWNAVIRNLVAKDLERRREEVSA